MNDGVRTSGLSASRMRTLVLVAVGALVIAGLGVVVVQSRQPAPLTDVRRLAAHPAAQLHYPGAVLLYDGGNEKTVEASASRWQLLGTTATTMEVVAFYVGELTARGYVDGGSFGITGEETLACSWVREVSVRIGFSDPGDIRRRFKIGSEHTTVFDLRVVDRIGLLNPRPCTTPTVCEPFVATDPSPGAIPQVRCRNPGVKDAGMTKSQVGTRESGGPAHVARASIPARLAAGRFGPTRLALLLAVISLPAVVIGIPAYEIVGSPDIMAPMSSTSPAVLAMTIPAVLVAALVAGSVGGLLVRRRAWLGAIATLALAWVIGVVVIPMGPIAVGLRACCHVGLGGYGLSITSPVSGVEALAFGWWISPFSAPGPFLVLLVGVAAWAWSIRADVRESRIAGGGPDGEHDGTGAYDPPDPGAESFARRIKRANSGDAYRRLRDDLRSRSDRGLDPLVALMGHKSQDVRSWAANVARKDLAREAIPALVEMAHRARVSDQDEAMQQLEAIDPELLRPFIPAMRRIFRQSKDLSGPGGAAMWRLVKLGDHDSAPLLRDFARLHDPRRYDHRMPLVLADYLYDPAGLVGRIASHDHEWMFWVATAARLLDVPGAEAALRDAARTAPDVECREIAQEEVDGLLRDRQAPQPSWDVETDPSLTGP